MLAIRQRLEMPMAGTIIPQRMTAEVDGDFVVFLIGMRINKPWKIGSWWPVFRAMRPMLKELDANPDLGCLGYTFGWPVIVQYWRSFDQLESYAKSRDHRHLPAWHQFNKIVSQARDNVGIWHETYGIHAGSYETVYSGMPPFGLGKAGRLVPASGARETARQRMTG
jgi:fumigallin biosynthesis monooxygenase-like protein